MWENTSPLTDFGSLTEEEAELWASNNCKHDDITIQEPYGEQFCEECGCIVDKD